MEDNFEDLWCDEMADFISGEFNFRDDGEAAKSLFL